MCCVCVVHVSGRCKLRKVKKDHADELPGFARPAAAAERAHVRQCHDIRGSKRDDRARPYGRSLLHSEKEMRERSKREMTDVGHGAHAGAEGALTGPTIRVDSTEPLGGSQSQAPAPALYMSTQDAVRSAEELVEPEPRITGARDGSGSSSFARADVDRFPMPDIPEVCNVHTCSNRILTDTLPGDSTRGG